MGKLVLIGLPIGNPQDITLRVLEILKNENEFAVEDTRSFKQLLATYDIDYSNKHIESFHDQSDERQINKIQEKLISGKTVFLCSEAGSPIISDPAYPLIKFAYDQQIEVDSYSGVSSLIYALELSGLPSHPMTFNGFFPRQQSKLDDCISKIRSFSGTHVYFESPHRIEQSLKFICNQLPDCMFVVVREISKTYQSVYRFYGKDFEQQYPSWTIKGEFVVLIQCLSETIKVDHGLMELASEVLNSKAKTKAVAKLLSEILEQPIKDIYQKLI